MSSTNNKNTKNRTDHINELFKALPMVEGFPLTEAELREFFHKAVKDSNIPIRKLSEKKEQSDGPKKTDCNKLFKRRYKEDYPDVKLSLADMNSAWNALSEEEKDEWRQKAIEENTRNGFKPTEKKESLALRQAKWQIEFQKWCLADESTRGPEPEMPTRAKPSKSTNISPDIQVAGDIPVTA